MMRGIASQEKLIAITGIAIAFFVGIGWLVSQSSSISVAQNTATTTAPLVTTQTVGSTTTYINHQFNFSISYPSALSATTTTDRPNVYPPLNLAQGTSALVLPHISAGGSTEGTFMVFASAAAKDVQNCTTTSAEAGAGLAGLHIASINGAQFTHYRIDQPGAGLFGVDDVYKALRGGTCFAIDEAYMGIETSHLTGTAAQNNAADTQAVSGELDGIMQSWQFLPPVNPAPSCMLSATKSSYAVGDPIALSWTSKNASSASWEEPADPSHPDTLVPPSGTPGVSGNATVVANIAGTHAIALDVEGPGGLASCRVPLAVSPSNAQPFATVTSLTETPNAPGSAPWMPTRITMSGTLQNPLLLNSDALDVIFVNSSYRGLADWHTLFWRVNAVNYDHHPQHDGEYVYVPVTSTTTTWSAQFNNYMPPGDYRYYVYAAPASDLATSTPLLAAGTFFSSWWNAYPTVTMVYPRTGSAVAAMLGSVPQLQHVYWTVPSGMASAFPSSYNLLMMLYLENQNNPSVSISINDGNDFLPGVASWNLYTAMKSGAITPGTYRIVWHLEAYPINYADACAQTVNDQCQPSAAAQAVMQQAQSIHGQTGWFMVE